MLLNKPKTYATVHRQGSWADPSAKFRNSYVVKCQKYSHSSANNKKI
jgi:hypothetical protein